MLSTENQAGPQGTGSHYKSQLVEEGGDSGRGDFSLDQEDEDRAGGRSLTVMAGSGRREVAQSRKWTHVTSDGLRASPLGVNGI